MLYDVVVFHDEELLLERADLVNVALPWNVEH